MRRKMRGEYNGKEELQREWNGEGKGKEEKKDDLYY